ncbi:MAG: DNA photolyase family protein, partial [Gammaproteobacteria bacterium]|nr:DNA photolyase family protein [Gammaproteobacteria bacterium]
KLNIKLLFFNASSVDIITQLVSSYRIDNVVWSNRHEPARICCELKIETFLHNKAIAVTRFKDGLISQPDEFLTISTNTPYKVFTPFYRRLRSELNFSDIYQSINTATEKTGLAAHVADIGVSLDQLKLIDHHSWHKKLDKYWSPGEQTAMDKLNRFVNNLLINYSQQRDYPELDATSGLSPHIHFGEISVQQIVTALTPVIDIDGGNAGKAAEGFLRQLIWREFARYILWHFPETSNQPMNPKFKNSFWKTDNVGLKKWQRGETGIALVDAGMKQLWETGTMHNRVRMLAASLLTKNLGIAWQQGARWFWDTLLDADLANNSMGWQWVAGCGVDAAPYYRIFNPETQALKYDKQGRYVKQWLNNDSAVNAHRPAIIDLASSRSRALDRYNRVIRNQNQH